ncbi:MAG: 50S ribosomal protein L18 [Ignavibacteria bacterium]|nr:50S ribosomal protein L18 [Ignavibacteria bacterium]
MERLKLKKVRRLRRKMRVRKKIFGTAERPRLTVYRSLKHFYGQIIDDNLGRTLVSCSTLEKELKQKLAESMKKVEQAKMVGKILGEKALRLGIDKVCFDRNGYLYHGRVRAFAEGAREAGLNF